MKKKILLVDDSSTILMMEKFILRNDPYILLTATDGDEAVRKAACDRPDLIVLDVHMPGVGGLEVARRIRENGELAEVPIILVETSNDAGAESIDAWTHAITKPINAIELLAKVRSLLDARR
jgi:CheY-like chemotaxis protein